MTEAPFQPNSPTSQAAAYAIETDTNRLRRLVGDYIRRCGALGCTDEEGQNALGLSGNTYRPRRVELFDKGSVQRTDRFRLTAAGRRAVVWVAC
ncbi:hypothetical protein EOD42_22630 [Rhodovarius crocodyli]|uniref:Uncharacterized protein n=1 Tax=Rhodovarius crocodyli TaxID=1979269 RepID=A0A437M1M1_9PROT|nr:hypothetical protein [Rhodovarius crocodyli]RVT91455.1 hypothetical protein EOD42_22630 [Rhodovarius crocodyli]